MFFRTRSENFSGTKVLAGFGFSILVLSLSACSGGGGGSSGGGGGSSGGGGSGSSSLTLTSYSHNGEAVVSASANVSSLEASSITNITGGGEPDRVGDNAVAQTLSKGSVTFELGGITYSNYVDSSASNRRQWSVADINDLPTDYVALAFIDGVDHAGVVGERASVDYSSVKPAGQATYRGKSTGAYTASVQGANNDFVTRFSGDSTVTVDFSTGKADVSLDNLSQETASTTGVDTIQSVNLSGVSVSNSGGFGAATISTVNFTSGDVINNWQAKDHKGSFFGTLNSDEVANEVGGSAYLSGVNGNNNGVTVESAYVGACDSGICN